MFFLNLTLGQFLILFGSISAVSVVLYLLDRSRRRQVVSTLRFWVAAEKPTAVVRRKRIQQPFSLLLQLLSMLLLLLAIAQLRVGAQGGRPRDHVLILDTSAWMNALTGKQTTLMDAARERARAYLKSLPAGDRVMLVRADALATPATAFESNRRNVERAITESEPGSTALNLDQAIEFARTVQSRSGRRLGEIAVIGTGRVAERDAAISTVPNLRVLPVSDAIENCGIRKMGLRRSNADPAVWDIYVSAKNYGVKPRQVTLALGFGGAPAGVRRLMLPAGAEREATFTHRTRSAGLLEARLIPGDSFADDDRAVLELPPLETLKVTVYSNSPDLLRPFLEANARVSAVFRTVAQYQPDDHGDDRGLVILDRFRPATRPRADTLWIDPPASESPVPVRSRVRNPESIRWSSDHPLGAGLRTRDVRLDATSVFVAAPGDIRVAEVESGPIILARPGTPKTIVLGFHPALSAMRYELATPLLFANILRWIAPDTFRVLDLSARSVGTVSVPLDSVVLPAEVKVLRADGTPIPFTLQDRSLHFFSGTRGTARVIVGDRESVYSLTLPEMWESKWEPPASARRGIPTFRESMRSSRDLWQILATLGALGLLAEWILFGRLRRGRSSLLSFKKAA